MEYVIANEQLRLTVQLKGGEISSLIKDGNEYMWNGDPLYWNRSAPVLFPFVGGLNERAYTYNGNKYPMGQHGFARDMEFSLATQTENQLVFALLDNEESYQKYPFHFRLELVYKLQDSKVFVGWRVVNTDTKPLYFSIGGHPAFLCPFANEENYMFEFLKNNKRLTNLKATYINENGLKMPGTTMISLTNGCLPISNQLFAHDAVILEDNQVDEISIIRPDGTCELKMISKAPLIGLWSPAGKKAPFLCIEPWYGRCDEQGYAGELMNREWGNSLEPGQEFYAEFQIII